MSAQFLTTCALFLLISFYGTVRNALAAPIDNMESVKDYLLKYGYDRHLNTRELMGPESISKMLKAFQKSAGLKESGELDEETQSLMKKPRCGVIDAPETRNNRFNEKFVLNGLKWSTNDLTYRITKYTNDMPKEEVRKIIQDSLKAWEEYSPLKFREVSTELTDNHFEIFFDEGYHGDNFPFDGPNGTLAHAYYPYRSPIGGDAHFDDAEQWTDDRFTGGTDLLGVATHEFGHSIGLEHSPKVDSVMYAYYTFFAPNTLRIDDIRGVQAIYGKNPKLPDEDACINPRVDDFATTGDDGIIIFVDDRFYILKDVYHSLRYPQYISDRWPEVGSNIDAAATIWSGNPYYLLIFKGNKYWKYANGKILEDGYPRDISKGFPGVPDNLDAAVDSIDGDIYFFKGSQYYKYVLGKGLTDDSPVSFSPEFMAINKGISGVERTRNQYFVTMGDQFYLLDSDMELYDREYFPLPIDTHYFQCDRGNQTTSRKKSRYMNELEELQLIKYENDVAE